MAASLNPGATDAPPPQPARYLREVDALRAAKQYEASPQLLLVTNAQGDVVTVNEAWTAATGWTLEQLHGRAWTDLLHIEDEEALAVRLAAGAATREVVRATDRDGAVRWLEGSLQRDPRGAMICVLRDITDGRTAMVQVQDARDSDFLMKLAGLARWTWDPDRGVVMSPQMVDIFGLRADQTFEGGDFLNLAHPDDQDRVRGNLGHAVEHGGSGFFHYRARHSDGRWLHLKVVYKTEPYATGSHCLQGMTQDVTELAETRDVAIQVEQQVRGLMEETQIASRRLKLALGAAQAGVFEIDHEARTFWCSPEFVLLIGRTLSFAEACQEPWPFIVPEDGPAAMQASKIWKTGTLLNEPLDVRVKRPDGEVRWMRLYYELRRDLNGRPRRSVGLALDIDERKRQELALVEAERAANAGAEAKSRFLASVSHEIRTPMNGVLGVLHLLKSESLSDDGRRLLDEALACGHMLSELINDVLDFSKIEANELELSPQPTDPLDIVNGVAALLRPLAQTKGLSLTVEADPHIGWVEVDPIRLRQALFNLVGNAVKFTMAGGVSVRLRLRDCGERLMFEVEDTGIGIPTETRARLFDRFQQGDTSMTRRFGGTGLGLAITRRLAGLMDGDVSFDSVEGEGSTFRLDISAPPADQPGAAEAETIEGLGGLRVLVVEDNVTNRLIARKLLEHLGAFVSEAQDGEEGVEAAARGGQDLILMDVQMPGMDGLEATRRIRAQENPHRRTPIIALTANVLAHQTKTYIEAGMDGVVPKPISPAVMLSEIARVAIQGLDDAAHDAVQVA